MSVSCLIYIIVILDGLLETLFIYWQKMLKDPATSHTLSMCVALYYGKTMLLFGNFWLKRGLSDVTFGPNYKWNFVYICQNPINVCSIALDEWEQYTANLEVSWCISSIYIRPSVRSLMSFVNYISACKQPPNTIHLYHTVDWPAAKEAAVVLS